MILTIDEYKDMGFNSEDDELTSACIKRAEYVLNGLSGGKAIAVVQANGEEADYVKQACAFQANAIIREELALRGENIDEKVSLGDFSYSKSSSGGSDYAKPLDTNFTVIRLLRLAGCLYTGTEVCE